MTQHKAWGSDHPTRRQPEYRAFTVKLWKGIGDAIPKLDFC